MKELEAKIQGIAASDLPVLIEGERGTGKQALARYIWSLSSQEGQFVTFHCAADTQAAGGKLPLLCPDNGEPRQWRRTLFLKQIGQLNRPFQQTLLTALETGLGAWESGERPSTRLVCSASEPLEGEVARRTFLADLYFRLAVCRILLPPLRQRPDDIPALFLALTHRHGFNGGPAPSPSDRLLEELVKHAWPGNVRELENVARTFLVSPDSEQILAELHRRGRTLPTASAGVADDVPLKEQVRKASKELESEIILRALERHRWNRRRAAETLQISYRALLYKMKDCRLRAGAEPAWER